MRNYKKLEIWELARQFAVSCYIYTQPFPREEVYNLTSQIRRASVSIAANIAEGSGRESDADFHRFIRIALGSLNEVETLFAISSDLGYISQEQCEEIETLSKDLGVRMRNLAVKLQKDLGTRLTSLKRQTVETLVEIQKDPPTE